MHYKVLCYIIVLELKYKHFNIHPWGINQYWVFSGLIPIQIISNQVIFGTDLHLQ